MTIYDDGNGPIKVMASQEITQHTANLKTEL
jgi:hypothetical protein